MQQDIAQIIGNSIRYLRKQAQFTQGQLADGIGTQAQISKIEKGEVIPLSTTLFEISSKFGIDINYFFDQAYVHRIDYVKEVKYQIRKEIRNRNYEEVERIIKCEEKNPAFKIGYNLQFILWHKGIVEFYNHQDTQKSLKTLETALNLGKKKKMLPISLQDIEILNSIAIIYNETKQYRLSIQNYVKSINHLKEIVDVPDRKVEIRLYYGLAKSLYKNQSYEESIKYCNKSINLCINEDLLYLLGEINYELGQNYQALTRNEYALKHYLRAKQLFQIGERLSFVKVVEKKIASLNL